MALFSDAQRALGTTFVMRHTFADGTVRYETPEGSYGGTVIQVVEVQQDYARDRLVLSLADGAVLARESMGPEFRILNPPREPRAMPANQYNAYSNQPDPYANQMQNLGQNGLGQMAQGIAGLNQQQFQQQFQQAQERALEKIELAKMEQERLRYNAMLQQQGQIQTPVERPAAPVAAKPAEPPTPARPVWPPRIEIDID